MQQIETGIFDAVSVLSDFTRFMVRLPHSGGISLTEISVLGALTRADGALRVSDLAASQEMTQPGMTQLITRMERAGLVARQAQQRPMDRRVVLVQITDEGEQLYGERDHERAEIFTRLYMQLDEEERERLSDALPVLARLIDIEARTRQTASPA